MSKRKTSESSFLEWRQGNARGLRDQCSLCVNNGNKLTSHTFQRFLTILCTFQEEMSKLCSIWIFFFFKVKLLIIITGYMFLTLQNNLHYDFFSVFPSNEIFFGYLQAMKFISNLVWFLKCFYNILNNCIRVYFVDFKINVCSILLLFSQCHLFLIAYLALLLKWCHHVSG